MNTSFLGLAVATVLTACGIETNGYLSRPYTTFTLQQYLPLAVLKLQILKHSCFKFCCVATVLTACGIETVIESGRMIPRLTVATVLTACGIETLLP